MNGGRRTRVGRIGTWLWIGFPVMLAGITHGDEPVVPLSVEASRLDVRVVHRSAKGGIGGTECTVDADCVDDDPCTQDLCVSGSCANRPISGCVHCEPSTVCPPLDVVFIMDTSGSMKDEAASLCASIDQILADLAAAGVTVRTALLGITEVPGTFGCLTNDVVSLLGGAVPGDSSTCPFPGSPSAFESWGPATAIVAERYDWAIGAARIIVPLADEGPCNGNRPDGCNDPGNDRDSIVNAVAVAQANDVIVSPITGTGSSACVTTLASALAAGTGGTAFATQDAGAQLPRAIVDLLLALCELDYTCDDGDFCTRDDVCIDDVCVGTPIPGCRPCTPVDMTCSDGNACTDDVCNDDLECITTPNYDADVFCCDPDDGVLTPIDDHDACTADVCDPATGQVDHHPMPDGTSCDDGLFCTVGDVCTGGVCHGLPRDCSHLSDACNVGVCDENTNACQREVTNENGPCDDHNACTTADRCAQGVCVGGPPLNCNDNNICTDDMCTPSTGCVHVNNTALCDDGNACTVDDRCASGRCASGSPRDCNDGNVCTMDYCAPTQGCIYIFNDGKACDDANLCTEDDVCFGGVCSGVELVCNDGNFCTDDSCDPAVGCVYVDNTLPCDDEHYCTVDDVCEAGSCMGTARDCSAWDDLCAVGVCNEVHDTCEPQFFAAGTVCDDGDFCSVLDACDAEGHCIATDVNVLPCITDADCYGSVCDMEAETCFCTHAPTLCLTSVTDGPYLLGDEVVIDVEVGFSSVVIGGGQFLIDYDPTILACAAIVPGHSADPSSPFIEIVPAEVDPAQGRIFYVVGVPSGGAGTRGPAVMARLRFRAVGACAVDDLCFLSINPRNTQLTDVQGNPVMLDPEPCCARVIVRDAPLTINCPGSVSVNADANGVTALVQWDPVEPVTHCHEDVELMCSATNNLGANVNHLIHSGGVFPSGLSEFHCTATSEWGDVVACSWSVHVSPANLVEVSVQLSPAMVLGPLTRCIEFEFYANCVEPPTVVEEVVDFGLPYNLPGHADNVSFKVPAGRYMCVAARDPLHTLRSVAVPEIVERKFVMVFKGDPFFGGNWLVGGNINGDHVIDILDFGVYNAQFGRRYRGGVIVAQPPFDGNTPCGTPGPHADINGDGMVDALDLSFIQRNLTLADKGSCCPGGQAAAAAILEISIPELEAMGLGDLRRADINGDGLLNEADIAALMAGR